MLSRFKPQLMRTAYTLIIGFVGAGLGYWLSFPVYPITGPAIFTTLLSLTGLRVGIAIPLRDVALLIIGIGIGAVVTPQTATAILQWPLAFIALGVMLVGIMFTAQSLLISKFGYGRQSAVLAATPGHLSFVSSMATSLNADVARISVVQSVRLFSLSMVVPFAAQAFGLELQGNILPTGDSMGVASVAILIATGFLLGGLFTRLNIPAPMLMGGIIVSSAAHIGDLTPGVLDASVALPAFVILGTMLGTRFSGVSPAMLRQSLMAGLLATCIAFGFTLLAALPVSYGLDIPFSHVMVAFAPGGLETMIAMGVVLGANPAFVAACHIARLLILLVLVPWLLSRDNQRQ